MKKIEELHLTPGTTVEHVMQAMLKINELISAHNEMVDRSNKKEEWIPKYGEKYWTITGMGRVFLTQWTSDTSDDESLAFNNIFPTREAAEHARDLVKETLENL